MGKHNKPEPKAPVKLKNEYKCYCGNVSYSQSDAVTHANSHARHDDPPKEEGL